MPPDADYFAFVSYSSENRKIGTRLHAALESYRIPQQLRGRPGPAGPLGPRLGPIFRDRTDLSSTSDLSSALTNALTRSKHLIVICSPKSAASRWVNREIEAFQELGRATSIVAVLADGKPRRFSEACPDGAFPPALFRPGMPEPFAPDLREPQANSEGGDGFDMALLKVLSRLIEVPLAELTQRHFEQERRRRRRTAAVASLMTILAALSVTGGLLTWRQTILANDRLTDAIGTASAQVEAAASYQDRFGVASAVTLEMFDDADRHFSELLAREESSPKLDLARMTLYLTLADFAGRVGRNGERDRLLQDASELNARLDATKPWQVRLGLMKGATDTEKRRAEISLLMAKAAAAIDSSDPSAGIPLAQDALRLAEAASLRHAARNAQCRLAELRYQSLQYAKAVNDYETCVSMARAVMQRGNDQDAERFLITALADYAKVLRPIGKIAESLAVQANAASLAANVEDDDQEDLLETEALFQARLLYGDALMANRIDTPDPKDEFTAALALADTAAAMDPARTDWQRRQVMALERLASLDLQRLCSQAPADRQAIFEKMQAHIKRSVEVAQALVLRDGTNFQWQRDLAASLLTQSAVLGMGGQVVGFSSTPKEEAFEAARQSEIRLRSLLKNAPDDLEKAQNLAAGLAQLALLSAELGEPAEVIERRFATAEDAYTSLLADRDNAISEKGIILDSDPRLWDLELLFVEALHAKFIYEQGATDAAKMMVQGISKTTAKLAESRSDIPAYSNFPAQIEGLFDANNFGEPQC